MSVQPDASAPCILIADWESCVFRDEAKPFASGSCQSASMSGSSWALLAGESTAGSNWSSAGIGKPPCVAPASWPEVLGALSMLLRPSLLRSFALTDPLPNALSSSTRQVDPQRLPDGQRRHLPARDGANVGSGPHHRGPARRDRVPRCWRPGDRAGGT